jgi:hypothetical protein
MELTTITNQALCNIIGSNGVTYSQSKNIFLSNGYESAAGNVYYKGMRMSDRIAVVYDLGQGYAHLFLNGIQLYGFRGKEKVLLASKSFCCYFFSETSARREVEQMVVDLLTAQLKLMGHAISNDVICSEASKLVSAVMENNPSRLLHA